MVVGKRRPDSRVSSATDIPDGWHRAPNPTRRRKSVEPSTLTWGVAIPEAADQVGGKVDQMLPSLPVISSPDMTKNGMAISGSSASGDHLLITANIGRSPVRIANRRADDQGMCHGERKSPAGWRK